jgi:hypothetical protein
MGRRIVFDALLGKKRGFLTVANLVLRCPFCLTALTTEAVKGTTPIGTMWLSVGVVCPSCHEGSAIRVTRVSWNAGVIFPRGKQSEGDSGAKVAEPADRRQIGRVVRGFQEVDLAPVATLDDILLFWDYQEKVHPETIFKENPQNV